MSTTSKSEGSSSSGSPVRRGRGSRGGGRGRSRSRSGSAGRGSGGGRGRGRGRSRERDVEREAVEDLLERQQIEMKSEVAAMTRDELQELLIRAIELQPGIMLDILRPAAQQPGGYHPSPGASWPDWCVCTKCREMPTTLEKKCCQKVNCVSNQANFDVLILNEGVLSLARLYRRDVLVFNDDADIRKANRHQAYRQFILWTHGQLGVGDRRVIPSCCVWKIRDKFPDPFGQYTGFVPSRLG